MFILSAFADEASPTLDGQINALKRNNVKNIEIRNVDGKAIITLDDNDTKEVKSKLDANGIAVSAIGSPIGKYNVTDDFAPHLEMFKKTVSTAQMLGTKRIRMFSFFIPKGEDANNYKDEVFNRLETMLDIAQKEGVFCCHENEKEIFGDIKDRALLLHKSLDRLKGIFDPANYIQCGQNPTDIIDELLPFIDYMHIKDAVMADGSVVPAGYGDSNIALLIKKFNDSNSLTEPKLLTVEPHLTVFEGLENLQGEGLKHKFTYKSQDEAFDAAVNALKTILDENGYEYK